MKNPVKLVLICGCIVFIKLPFPCILYECGYSIVLGNGEWCTPTVFFKLHYLNSVTFQFIFVYTLHLRNDCHMQPMSHKVTNYHMIVEMRGDIYIKACFPIFYKILFLWIKKKTWEVYSDWCLLAECSI